MNNPLDISKDKQDNAFINGLKYNIRNIIFLQYTFLPHIYRPLSYKLVGDHEVFIASLFWKKLQTFLENVVSPFWRNVHLHGVTDATPWKQTFFVKSC